MHGSGGVGAVMAFAFAAFWLLVEVFVEPAETAVDEATEGWVLLTAVETETIVFEAITAADVFAAQGVEDFLDEVVEFGVAAEAGFDGGFAVEGAFAEDAALEETLEVAFEGAFDGALDPAFDSAFADAGLLAVFVTVFDEVPLTFIFVSTTTISLPLAAVSEPATLTPSKGVGTGAGATTQGVTITGMASMTGIGGGGAGATGW